MQITQIHLITLKIFHTTKSWTWFVNQTLDLEYVNTGYVRPNMMQSNATFEASLWSLSIYFPQQIRVSRIICPKATEEYPKYEEQA